MRKIESEVKLTCIKPYSLSPFEKFKKHEKDTKECTFTPRIGNKSNKNDKVKTETDDFYQRNIEWQTKIISEAAQKQEERLSQVFRFHTTKTQLLSYYRTERLLDTQELNQLMTPEK